jgi:SAM-dependent methyltransferase
MIKSILSVYKSIGVSGLLAAFGSRLIAQKARCFPLCAKLLSSGVGLEIGGPSSLFKKRRMLPIYSIINNLDNCNFADCTIWEGSISSGSTFLYNKHRPLGHQYISEATNLKQIKSETYDFILSSHVLEHIANPLCALYEWIRVLKEEGIFVLILPHKEGTFDHKRKVTALSHLIKDYEQETKESDLSHLPEILMLHDLKKDLGVEDAGAFKTRSEDNFVNRCLHHHVFVTSLVIEIVHYLNLQILAVEAVLPFHIIIIAKKIKTGNLSINDNYFGNDAGYKRISPFVWDKQSLNQENS